MPTQLQGGDVSHHNDPASLPLNVDFMIVRISFGMPDGRVLPDLAAEEHLQRLASVRRDDGRPFLAGYHYLATGEHAASGEAQGEFFERRRVELSQRFGPMGAANDTEPLRNKDAQGRAIPWDPADRVRDRVMGFNRAMTDAGRKHLVYGSREWLARLSLPWWFAAEVALWAASMPPAPDPWHVAAIQQLPRPVGGVDRNVFAGSVEELRALFGIEAGAGCPV